MANEDITKQLLQLITSNAILEKRVAVYKDLLTRANQETVVAAAERNLLADELEALKPKYEKALAEIGELKAAPSVEIHDVVPSSDPKE